MDRAMRGRILIACTKLQRARALHARANDLDPATLEPLESGIIWSLVLDRSVLADLESQFSWIAAGHGLDTRSAPAPYHYLYAGRSLTSRHAG